LRKFLFQKCIYQTGSPSHESVPEVALSFKKVGDPWFKIYHIHPYFVWVVYVIHDLDTCGFKDRKGVYDNLPRNIYCRLIF